MLPSPPSNSSYPWGEATTPYTEIGGEDRVRELAEAFYDIIDEESPTLQAMLPANTKNTRQKFFMYLSGWLGGPPLYEEKWGHPRLRMRHMPFPIGTPEAEEWMRCMRLAMDRTGIGDPLRSFLDQRFTELTAHMRNQPDS
jgi:hemoglobin